MMNRRTPMIGLAAFALTLAFAVPVPRAAASEGPAALHGGAWSLELDRDMGSGYVSDNEVSIKRMSGAGSGFRLAFGLNYNGGSGPGTETDLPSGTTSSLNQSYFNRSHSVRLNWVHYFAQSENFAAQLGLGPVMTVNSYYSANGDASGYRNVNKSTLTQIGGEVNLGAEWFFTNHFSLGGRAGVAALTGKQKYTYEYFSGSSGYRDVYDYTQNRIVSDPARIFLGAYF